MTNQLICNILCGNVSVKAEVHAPEESGEGEKPVPPGATTLGPITQHLRDN